jgi:hypothetical protein
MKNRQDLVLRALSELGRLYTGEAPPAEDFAAVDALVDPLIDQIMADGVVYVGDVNQIENAFFLPLGRLLAIEASNVFGSDAIQTLLTRNRSANVDALKEREYETLRRINWTGPTYAPLRADYF